MKLKKNTFEYVLHLLNHEFPTFFINFYPTINDKGNNYMINILLFIACKYKQQNLNIIRFFSDGNNAMF